MPVVPFDFTPIFIDYDEKTEFHDSPMSVVSNTVEPGLIDNTIAPSLIDNAIAPSLIDNAGFIQSSADDDDAAMYDPDEIGEEISLMIDPVVNSSVCCTPSHIPKYQYPLITFIVGGPNPTIFHVPLHIVQSLTSIFNHYLSISCDPILLPNDSAATFNLVLHYAERNSWLSLPPQYQDTPEGHFISFEHIISIYIFAFHSKMPSIQNAATNLFVNRVKYTATLPNRRAVYYLWSHIPPGSALKCLLIDLVREMWLPNGHKEPIWVQLVGGWIHDWKDVWRMVELLYMNEKKVRVSERIWKKVLGCQWHVHGFEEFCEGSEEFRLGEEGGPGDGRAVLFDPPIMGALVRDGARR